MMVYYIQTSVTGLALLTIIAVGLWRGMGRGYVTGHIFGWMVGVTAALLTLELALNVGQALAIGLGWIVVIVTLFYNLNPVPSALWAVYVRVFLRRRAVNREPVFAAVVLLPVIVTAVLALLSAFAGPGGATLLFSVNESGEYARGALFPVLVLSLYWNQLVALALMASRRATIPRRERFALFFFAVPPIIAGTFQALFFGLSLLWLALAISLLIVYLDIQGALVFSDHLTALGNRRRYERYLEYLNTSERRRSAHERVGAVVIDLNRFKLINDTWGHALGDQALEAVGMILNQSVRRRDLCARTGGDEFAVLMEVGSERQVHEVVERIRTATAAWNAQNRLPFELSLGIGAVVHDAASGESIAKFLERVDDDMYRNKLAAR